MLTDPAEIRPLLEVVSVSKHYGATAALRDVSMTVMPGTVRGLLGANGAGKSSLVRVISGVEQPDSGQVLVAGEPMRRYTVTESQAAGVATIPQTLDLVPTLSVRENLVLARPPRHRLTRLIDWRRVDDVVASVIARLRPESFPAGKRLVRSLSARDRYMVAIGRALVREPRLLVMDEPTAALSSNDVDVLLGVIAELKRDGLAIVFISHRLDEVLSSCDDITVLRDGAVIATTPTTEIGKGELADLIAPAPRTRVTKSDPVHGTPQPDSADVGRPGVLDVSITRAGAVANVEFSIPAGEIAGLVGRVGSGRTTILRAIYGALPFSGSVSVDGEPASFQSPVDAIAAGVVLLPEDRMAFGLIPDGDVLSNLTLQAISSPPISRFGLISLRSEKTLAEGLRSRYQVRAASLGSGVRTLSGGNQQRVLFARASSTSPRVWLLDQPTSGLDVGAQADMAASIRELAAGGSAVLIVDEDLEFLAAVCDRFLLLKEGKIIDSIASDRIDISKVVERVH